MVIQIRYWILGAGLCFYYPEISAQERYLDIKDTTAGVRYHIVSGNSYFIRLYSDSAPKERKITSIYREGMILCSQSSVCDSVSFQDIDSIRVPQLNTFLKTYTVLTIAGMAYVAGSFLTLPPDPTNTRTILTYLSIPIGLIILPVAGTIFLKDILYPYEFINTSPRYNWYYKKVKKK